jgi:g-D-glutamyl-meso-diaminopimelate peptidase
MRADLTKLQARYPYTLRAGVIGKTAEGRELMAALAGAPGASRHVLIHAGLHAREHMTCALAMMQLERLLRRHVPAGFNFHILPMMNPDGVAISQTGCGSAKARAIYMDDLRAGYATPPRKEALAAWKANAGGVDLNRNFEAGWERVDTRPAPSGANYRGDAPLSERESQALAAYTTRFKMAATVSYHASGGVIYCAFGPDCPANEKSRRLGHAISKRTGYRLEGDDGTSSGGYKDWAIEKLSIPSLTVEIGDGPAPLAIEEYRDIWRRNRDVPYAVARWVKKHS